MSKSQTISTKDAQAIIDDGDGISGAIYTSYHCPSCGDADTFCGDSIFDLQAGDEIQGMPCTDCDEAPLIIMDGQTCNGKKIVEE